jgi:hypothetical protein
MVLPYEGGKLPSLFHGIDDSPAITNKSQHDGVTVVDAGPPEGSRRRAGPSCGRQQSWVSRGQAGDRKRSLGQCLNRSRTGCRCFDCGVSVGTGMRGYRHLALKKDSCQKVKMPSCRERGSAERRSRPAGTLWKVKHTAPTCYFCKPQRHSPLISPTNDRWRRRQPLSLSMTGLADVPSCNVANALDGSARDARSRRMRL